MNSFVETPSGYIFENDHICVFFGTAKTDADELQKLWPEITFKQIRQTHSDILIETTSTTFNENTESDAHWTAQSHLGLVIRTADCIPLMIFDLDKKIIVSIHAGWKGVANEITRKSLEKLQIKNAYIFIGPHIRQKSFEVDQDVLNLLLKTLPVDLDSSEFYKSKNNKYYPNLQLITLAQIKKAGVNIHQLFDINQDTLSDDKFHSHRRSNNHVRLTASTPAGRNLSFIFLK